MFKLPSPLQEVSNHDLDFTLFTKRDDAIHPLISGNKYRKLKYNIVDFRSAGGRGIISFGGVYSNHLHALAAMCSHEKIPLVAIVRGEDHSPHPTLDFIKASGATIFFVSREAYRLKENHSSIQDIVHRFPDYTLIPEGGSNKAAIRGVTEIIDECIVQNCIPDYIAVAAGTGATAAGLIQACKKNKLPSRVMVFSALKGVFLRKQIAEYADCSINDFFFTDDFSLGGYARVTKDYIDFLHQFEEKTGIEIDPIYNGKVIWGLHHMNNSRYIKPNQSVLWIHTGGLQGKAGLNSIR